MIKLNDFLHTAQVYIIFGNPRSISICPTSRLFPTMWRMAPNMNTLNVIDVGNDVILSLIKRRSLFSDQTSATLFTADMAEPHNYRWVCLISKDCYLSIQLYCWLNLLCLTNFINIKVYFPDIIFTTYSRVEYVCLLIFNNWLYMHVASLATSVILYMYGSPVCSRRWEELCIFVIYYNK